ncbi:hypothetical protein [Chryseobacterium soli]|uniref:hypothetical protein n=1 Tax=Chryseobacterium soli TaxID=445961 RepID=UPI000AB6BB79|nr:hypothetical protein [Chryseobacterium soli]
MEDRRLNWVKSVYPDFSDKKHFYENVYKPEDFIYRDFFIEQPKRYKSKINPQRIVGISYGFAYNCYRKINWHQLLNELHRFERIMKNFSSREDIIDNHILRKYDEDTEGKNVLKFGSHYFTTSGQHRLCLAKFLELESVEVEVTEFKLDRARIVRFKRLKTGIEKLRKYKLIEYYTFDDLVKASEFENLYLNNFSTIFRIRIALLAKFIEYYEKFYIFKPLARLQLIFASHLYPNRINETVDIFEEEDFKRANFSIIKHKSNLMVQM